MLEALIERVYEAAVVPDLWQDVVDALARYSGSMSSAMLLVDRDLPPLWVATENVHDQLSAFSATPGWYDNPRLNRMLRRNHAGFARDIDISTPEELAADSHAQHLRKLGVGWQTGSAIVMPTGETVVFTIERAVSSPNYDAAALSQLDLLRPHLARASLLAARLGLQRALTTVQTLDKVGLPAAVVSQDGSVLASNGLFETRAGFLRPAAYGRLSLADRSANALLQAALLAKREAGRLVRSIPVRFPRHGELPAVVHVMPLTRSAIDLFNGGNSLIVVTTYDVSGRIPADAVLRGLFDLSASEAVVAAALASGKSISEIAASRSISLATARTHLAQLFQKTGTHQQSALVALIKSAHPIV